MRPFTQHVGVAAPLLQANIDTDAIVPSREMRQVSKTGLAKGLFANWRYTDVVARRPDPEFVLNRKEYAGTSILLSGGNFGCGSSREYAVWALLEFGVRAIVAPSFGAIFQKNCIANGLLPAVVPDAQVRALAQWVEDDPQRHRLSINLVTVAIGTSRGTTSFAIRAADRTRLLEGQDPIDHTLTRSQAIEAFERERFKAHGWARCRGSTGEGAASAVRDRDQARKMD